MCAHLNSARLRRMERNIKQSLAHLFIKLSPHLSMLRCGLCWPTLYHSVDTVQSVQLRLPCSLSYRHGAYSVSHLHLPPLCATHLPWCLGIWTGQGNEKLTVSNSSCTCRMRQCTFGINCCGHSSCSFPSHQMGATLHSWFSAVFQFTNCFSSKTQLESEVCLLFFTRLIADKFLGLHLVLKLQTSRFVSPTPAAPLLNVNTYHCSTGCDFYHGW